MRYNIKNRDELKAAIVLLETEVDEQKQLLSSQLNGVYESFTPINIARNLISEVVTSEQFRSNLLTATVGITTGYVAKKLFVRGKGSLLKMLTGNFLQYGIANLILNPARILKSVIFPILEFLAPEKTRNQN